jgi:hypothetical protein
MMEFWAKTSWNFGRKHHGKKGENMMEFWAKTSWNFGRKHDGILGKSKTFLNLLQKNFRSDRIQLQDMVWRAQRLKTVKVPGPKELELECTRFGLSQGDQIGRILVYWASVYFGSSSKIKEVEPSLGYFLPR